MPDPRILLAYSGQRNADEWGNYRAAVEQAGGMPIDIAPEGAQSDLDLADYDGLLLTGGVDVDPARYGAERDRRTEPPFPERDELEIALATAALERKVPLLAICRGLQLLNVVCGGSLHQHIADVDPHRPRRIGGASEWQSGWHDVVLRDDSLVARIAGATTLHVNSRHHQAVTPDRLAPEVIAVGSTTHGGFTVVEALEVPGHPFALAVQWHPERPEMRADHSLEAGSRALFNAFVDACRRPRE